MASNLVTNTQLPWYLSDRGLVPIASSPNTSPVSLRSQHQPPHPLSSVTASAITAYDTASRLGLGLPQRIMIETRDGPILLHSYLNPPPTQRPQLQNPTQENGRSIVDATREELRPLSGGTDSTAGALVNGFENGEQEAEEDEDTTRKPPLLIASVVARSATQMPDARRAAADIERFGRHFQRDCVAQQDEPESEAVIPAGEDG